MKKNMLTIALTICLSFQSTAQIPPANIVSGINELFQGHVNQTAGLVPGHVIRIEKPGAWVYSNSAGLASVSPPKNAESEMKFKIASITKMFTAVAIFKLIENGRVDFNAPISTYLPLSLVQGFENYQNITVKRLLNHTSGINEPQSDFQGRLNYWIYMKRFEEIPLDSLIIWSYANPRGVGSYYYSNTNFHLLAEIIKSVSGGSYQNYIINNVINPLGLTNTDFNTIPSGSFLQGYLRGSFYPIGGVANGGLEPDSLYNFTEASNSWGYGAADIWSNTTDLIKFHKALFSGQVISSKWLDTMKVVVMNTGDMGAYGHGMIQFKSFNGGPIYGFGHTGTAFGYGAMLCYIPNLDVYMCSAGNYMKIGQEFLQRDIYNFLNNNKGSADILDPTTNILVNIFPNPATNILNLGTTSSNFQVSIYSLTGQRIFERENIHTIDVSYLPKGLYLLKLNDLNSKKTITKKFIHE